MEKSKTFYLKPLPEVKILDINFSFLVFCKNFHRKTMNSAYMVFKFLLLYVYMHMLLWIVLGKDQCVMIVLRFLLDKLC